MARATVNYINNRTLYEHMCSHHKNVQEAKAAGTDLPRVPEYVGKALQLICKKLSTKGNFSGYTFKEEMIGDGILDCIAAVNNFNPAKTNNPFAYFTQIAWNAFIRRITREAKQTYIKHKNYESSFVLTGMMDEGDIQQLKSNDYRSDIISQFESKLTKPKKDQKISPSKGIETFSESTACE